MVALAASLVLTPAIVALVRKLGLVDVPNERSMHSAFVPRGGGLAVAVAAGAVTIGMTWWDGSVGTVVFGAVVLGALGLIDDRRGLPPVVRLTTQAGVAVAVAVSMVDRSGVAMMTSAAFVVVWCVGYVNAFNFMDGINGISASQAAVAGGFLVAIARQVDDVPVEIASAAIAGAALGFLPYNAVRPKVFLGDVGSYFIGFWLAASALLLWDAGAPPLVLVAPFALYLADTSVVLARRWRRGDSLFEAHREHAYQRLVQLGWSHVAVAALCCAISAVNSLIMYLTVDSEVRIQLVVLSVVVVLVAGYLALPTFISRSRSATRSGAGT